MHECVEKLRGNRLGPSPSSNQRFEPPGNLKCSKTMPRVIPFGYGPRCLPQPGHGKFLNEIRFNALLRPAFHHGICSSTHGPWIGHPRSFSRNASKHLLNCLWECHSKIRDFKPRSPLPPQFPDTGRPVHAPKDQGRCPSVYFPTGAATLRRTSAIQAGAYCRSLMSCCLSLSDSLRLRVPMILSSTCGRRSQRRAWITVPLMRPAVAIFRGVVCFRMIWRLPSWTFRDFPSVRYTARTGTCSDNPRRLAA